MKKIILHIRGLFGLILLITNTIFWCTPLAVVAVLKLILPFGPWRKLCTRLVTQIAVNWTSCNNFNIDHIMSTKWTMIGDEVLDPEKNYLVMSNHVSGVDIVALQKVLNRKIPFFRFFLKKELIWVPVLGLAWWALDYPFMKRYSKEYLAKYPHMRGKDMQVARRACERYQELPVSIVNFVEGTRFTKKKHTQQQSAFKNLLKPKAGGVGYVLSAMGQNIDSILNITLVYPGKSAYFWDFLSGSIPEVIIHIEKLPLKADLLGNYIDDEKYRRSFQKWLNIKWKEKDLLIDTINKK